MNSLEEKIRENHGFGWRVVGDRALDAAGAELPERDFNKARIEFERDRKKKKDEKVQRKNAALDLIRSRLGGITRPEAEEFALAVRAVLGDEG